MRAALVAEFYGPAHYGGISGVSAFCITVAQALGPDSAGITFDYYGSYTVPIRVLTCV